MNRPQNAGLYVHVPFCAKKCLYCDFYSLPYTPDLGQQYICALQRAFEYAPALGVVDSVYFGGGTPSLLGAGLVLLLDAIRQRFTLAPHCEITLEANPGDCTAPLLALLRQAGFNRLSLGVQSALDTELAALGRRHTVRDVEAALAAAADAGFANISLDLMLGIPGQTANTLAQSVKFCGSATGVTHVSAYLLKIEENTPFGRLGAEKLGVADEDAAAELYLQATSLLDKQGFAQYEISNFAKAGYAARHNTKYWTGADYLGLGPAAHSLLNGQRFYFAKDLQAFMAAPNPMVLTVPDGIGGDMQEHIMLRLRLVEGILLAGFTARFGSAAAQRLQAAAGKIPPNLITITPHSIALTTEGFLLSNSITAALL